MPLFAQFEQIPQGTWRMHTSYYNIEKLLETPRYVYCANKLHLFRYDKLENLTEPVSKLEGLSDATVGALGFDPKLNVVVIGYQSGNIDLLYENGTVFNLNAIVRANISGDKTINHINVYNSQAYISCGFGLVIVNIARKEVKLSNVNLGAGNSSIAINATAVLRDTLYVATADALLSVPLSANLQNSALYFTYRLANGVPIGPSRGYKTPSKVTVFNNNLYVYYRDDRDIQGSILCLVTNKRVSELSGSEFKGDMAYLAANDKELVATMVYNKIVRLNLSNERTIVTGPPLLITFSAIPAIEGGLWIGEYFKKLYRYNNNEFVEIKASGIYMENPIMMSSSSDKVLFAAGSYESRFYGGIGNQGGFATLDAEGWKNTPFVYKTQSTYSDCSHIIYSERWKKSFASLWGGGLLITNDDSSQEVLDYSTPGSTLGTATQNPAPGYTRISCSAVDNNGLLWMGNFTLPTGRAGLHSYNLKTKQFTAVIPPNNSDFSYQCPIDILIADNNDKWVRIAPNRNTPASIWVVSDNPNNQHIISTTSGQGGLPATNVNDMAKDVDGAIWLATDKGLAVFYSPSVVTRSTSYNAFLPIFDGRPVLENEAITAIAIDGGGRKWVGTRSKGVFLFNKELTKVLKTFTAESSPLLSDQILDIAINKATGEVFFATDQGLVSFRSAATDAKVDNGGIKVFPNPVNPQYDGLLGITGLPDDAEIKITDIAGRKVYEGKANGGALSWGLTDYNGRRAKTGIYLVFAAQEGGDKQVAKFAVVE